MNLIRKVKEKFQKFAWTHGFSCDVCKAELFEYPKRRFCKACEEKMYRNDGKICEKCGRKTVTDGVCLTCKSLFPRFAVGISPFLYQGQSAELINRLKKGNRTLAPYFSEKMADVLLSRKEVWAEETENSKQTLWIIPVPMTAERMRERGFNQAELLAYGVAKRLEEEGICVELRKDILEKKRDSKQQKHASYRERFENVAGVYRIAKRAECRGKSVILVDDIMTTGATGSECASRLYTAGAKQVVFLTATSLPERK